MDERNQEGGRNCLPAANTPHFPECGPADRMFAVVYLLVGYGFIHICSSWNFERNLAVFTICYAVVVLAYLWGKKIRPARESWFWLAVMLAMGLPYAFWSVLYVLQVWTLIAVAAYWTLSASGRLIGSGRTSDWVLFDGCNAMIVVPFSNFGCQVRVLWSCTMQEGDQKKMGKAGAILLGIVIVLPALLIILPLLVRADAGFQHLMSGLTEYMTDHLLVTFLRICFAVPTGFYLFGLVFGGIHGENTGHFREETLAEKRKSVRKVPDTAVCTALVIICLVYCLFIGLQGNYLFSAFAGVIPETFTYAEYARRGFFELCQIGAWNLLFVACAGTFSRSDGREHKGLGFLTGCLSVLTFLLLATAVSKMGMYISVYGLTVLRILPLVFMLWMGLVFVCILVHQKKEFPMVRFCVMAGAVMFCLLCILPVEHWTELYNVWARARGLIV